MRDLPVALKVILNIILYIFYVLVASIAFSFIFPLVLQLFGADILDPANPVFAKIQLFIAFLVLVVSVIMRKYFYICFGSDTVHTVKTENDEGLKIQIEKEIK